MEFFCERKLEVVEVNGLNIFNNRKHIVKFIVIIIIMSAFAALFHFGLRHKLKAQTVSEIKEYLVQNEYWNDKNMITYNSEDYSTLTGATNNLWSVYFLDYGNNKKEFEHYISTLLSEIEIKSEVKKLNYVICESDNETNYSLYICVDNTFLMISGPKKEKGEIIELASALGYYQK